MSFREIHYTPRYGKFQGKALHGVQLHLEDPHAIRPLHTSITILCTLLKLYGDKLEFEGERALGIHWGSLSVFEALRAGKSAAQIEAMWRADLDAFAKVRAALLAY